MPANRNEFEELLLEGEAGGVGGEGDTHWRLSLAGEQWGERRARLDEREGALYRAILRAFAARGPPTRGRWLLLPKSFMRAGSSSRGWR